MRNREDLQRLDRSTNARQKNGYRSGGNRYRCRDAIIVLLVIELILSLAVFGIGIALYALGHKTYRQCCYEGSGIWVGLICVLAVTVGLLAILARPNKVLSGLAVLLHAIAFAFCIVAIVFAAIWARQVANNPRITRCSRCYLPYLLPLLYTLIALASLLAFLFLLSAILFCCNCFPRKRRSSTIDSSVPELPFIPVSQLPPKIIHSHDASTQKIETLDRHTSINSVDVDYAKATGKLVAISESGSADQDSDDQANLPSRIFDHSDGTYSPDQKHRRAMWDEDFEISEEMVGSRPYTIPRNSRVTFDSKKRSPVWDVQFNVKQDRDDYQQEFRNQPYSSGGFRNAYHSSDEQDYYSTPNKDPFYHDSQTGVKSTRYHKTVVKASGVPSNEADSLFYRSEINLQSKPISVISVTVPFGRERMAEWSAHPGAEGLDANLGGSVPADGGGGAGDGSESGSGDTEREETVVTRSTKTYKKTEYKNGWILDV